jgi:hypothetical protein
MKRLYGILLLVGLATGARAQDASCTQILRSIRQIYTEGRLQEIPTTLDRSECFTRTEGNGGFSQQERVEAYKTLTLAYIYLEEPEKADEAMLNLLSTDHFFQTDENLDPAEFISLYKKFRTWPLFRAGIKLGVSATLPEVMADYYVTGNSNGQGKYSPSVGFTIGLAFEKDLFRTSKSKFLNRLILNPELSFTGRGFKYALESIYESDEGDPLGSSEAPVTQSWLDLNAVLQYQVRPGNAFNPYVGLGGGVNYLMSASSNGFQTASEGVEQGPDFDLTPQFEQLNYSIIAMAGLKLRVGGIYLTGDIQYQYGLMNVVSTENRYSNPELHLGYGLVFDDLRQHTVTARIGVLYAYFKPLKLIR